MSSEGCFGGFAVATSTGGNGREADFAQRGAAARERSLTSEERVPTMLTAEEEGRNNVRID